MFDRIFLPIYMLTGMTAVFILVGFAVVIFVEKRKRSEHHNGARETAENKEINRFRLKLFTAKDTPFHIDGRLKEKTLKNKSKQTHVS